LQGPERVFAQVPEHALGGPGTCQWSTLDVTLVHSRPVCYVCQIQWVFRFSHRCGSDLCCSWIWRLFTGWLVPDVSKQRGGLIFEDETQDHHTVSKHRVSVIQWWDVTSHKNGDVIRCFSSARSSSHLQIATGPIC